MFRNKRGQFYIIFAVLVIIIITGLVTTANYANKVKKPVKFYDLSEDFESETTKIIDYGVFSSMGETEIENQITLFADEYLTYAQKKDPNLQLLYIYGDKDGVLVDNYALEDMEIITHSGEEVNGSAGSEGVLSKITIHYGEKEFTKEIGEKMRHFTEVKRDIGGPGSWIQVNLTGIIHTFDLSENENFYYVAVTAGEEKEIHVAKTPEELSELLQ